MANCLGLVAFCGLIAAQFLAVIGMLQYHRNEEHAESEPSRARKFATV
jgi:hypothetical protein